MKRCGRDWLDEHERTERRRRRSIEVRQPDSGRRYQRLFGAAGAAALAARSERQVAVVPQVRRVQPPHDKQVREQSRQQDHRNDATMPQRQSPNPLDHASFWSRTPARHNRQLAQSCEEPVAINGM
jgi:hypothetical protein